MKNSVMKLIEIDLDLIEFDENQPRKEFDTSDLEASIPEVGLLVPSLVSETVNGRYILRCGERRIRALRARGIKSAPCIVKDINEKDVPLIQLIENIHKKDLRPFEIADQVSKLHEAGMTHTEISKVVKRPRSFVTELCAVARIPVNIRLRCQTSDISFEHLFLIARQKDDKAMSKVLDATLAGDNMREVREVAKLAKKSEKAKNDEADAVEVKFVHAWAETFGPYAVQTSSLERIGIGVFDIPQGEGPNKVGRPVAVRRLLFKLVGTVVEKYYIHAVGPQTKRVYQLVPVPARRKDVEKALARIKATGVSG